MPSYLASIRERVLNQLADVVNEVVPAYASLLVYYEPRNVRVYDLQLARCKVLLMKCHGYAVRGRQKMRMHRVNW